MAQIPINITILAVLFLTHPAARSLAQYDLSCSTYSSQATYPRVYLRIQRWNLGSSEAQVLLLRSLSPSKIRVPSVFHPRRSSTSQEEDTYHHPYLHLGYSPCLTTTSCPSLLPRGVRMRCRPRPLYRSLCSESLQVSKRLKLGVTTMMAMATGTWLSPVRATIARRAISPLIWHRTASLTLARPP